MNTMKIGKTLLFFILPGLVIFLLFTFAYQCLIKIGIPIYWATYICLWFPLIIQFFLIILFFLRSKEKVSNYFYFEKINIKQIGIITLGLIIVQIFEQVLSFTRPLIAKIPGFGVPVFFPDLFQANLEIDIPIKTLLGMNIKNNPIAILFFSLWLFTNILCEETLWRGYALPRMEKYFGKWAWLINGLLWNFAIHFFFRWSFITLLPISLAVPYLCQKYRSIWPGVIIHGIGNSLLLILVIISV